MGPFDPSKQPTPNTDRRVLPLDAKTHLELGHHTRTADPEYPVYAATASPNTVSPCGNTWAAPLASPDSARSIADEWKIATAVLPPLPETSPPRTRVTLAREESVELLTDDTLDSNTQESDGDEHNPGNSTPVLLVKKSRSKSPNNDRLSGANKISNSKIVSSSRQEKHGSRRSNRELSTLIKNERRSDSNECVTNCNVVTKTNLNEEASNVSNKVTFTKDSVGVIDRQPNNLLKRGSAEAILQDDRLTMLLKGTSNKENLRPNITFELPSKPAVETLL